jgi:predicted RNA-binding Zn ribbon-like protein
MSDGYLGPLGNQPIAIELHNTCYTVAGSPIDGLEDASSRQSFLGEIVPRFFPEPLSGNEMPSWRDLQKLRTSIRTVLHNAIDGEPYNPAAVADLNAFTAQAPTALTAEIDSDDPRLVHAAITHHRSRMSDIILANFAADAIDLITADARQNLRACDAPGCVMVYLRGDPRQQWCSKPCGNRARQARHYHRTHAAPRHE